MESNRELFAKSCFVFTMVRGLNLTIEEDIRLRLKDYEVGFSSFRILWILFFAEQMTMSDLSEISQTNISNVYRQLLKLKDNDLVDIKSGEDARIKEVSLTNKGQTLVHHFIDEKSTFPDFQLSSILATVPREDIDKFIQVGSILSSKLIGGNFINFAKNISQTIVKNDNSI
ncbi:MarR family winged helix-turn-helix transcriptional regulator [Mesobacillus maritimus]|uniref:MarR family winged helix-turn-helix transcriptional regulator n=1 Tax=Mesobacillus maritimus TaxID=1643336 RepID=UPI00384F987F